MTKGQANSQEDAYTLISKRNKFNNALIEKASMEIMEKKKNLGPNTQSEAVLEKNRNQLNTQPNEDPRSYRTPQRKTDIPHDVMSRRSYLANSQDAKSYMSKRLYQTND